MQRILKESFYRRRKRATDFECHCEGDHAAVFEMDRDGDYNGEKTRSSGGKRW